MLLCSLFLFLFIPFYPIQLISFIVLLIFFLSYSYSYHVRYHITVTRSPSYRALFKFENETMGITVENRSFLPIMNLAVSDYSGGLYTGNGEQFFVHLKPKERTTLTYNIKGYRRGEYSIGPIRLQGSDPLGLFGWEEVVPAEGTIIVYPRLYSFHFTIKRGLPTGNVYTPNPIYKDITRYRSVREYLPGDDIRTINWKTSAKMGTLHSMELLSTLYFQVLVMVNVNIEEYPLHHRYHRMERAIDTSASVVMAAVSSGQEVGFLSNGSVGDASGTVSLPIGASIGHATVILNTLARLRPIATTVSCVPDLLSMIKIPYGCRIIYIGPPLHEDQIAFLWTFGKANRSIELYYPAWDIQDVKNRESRFVTRLIPEYGDIVDETGK